MTPEELRAIRVALDLSQQEFAERLGLSRVMVGLMERGEKPISARTAAAAKALSFRPSDAEATAHDPMERIIEAALLDAGIEFKMDHGGGTRHRLDFELANGVAIEVKRFHSPRAIEQLSRVENVIFVQGDVAARQLADLIRRAGMERRREAIAAEMEDLENRLFAEPPERRRECDGMKRQWNRRRNDMAGLGVRVRDIDWGDGTTSADFPVKIAA